MEGYPPNGTCHNPSGLLVLPFLPDCRGRTGLEASMTSAAQGISHSEELFIDGRWVAPSTSGRLHPVNPATEQVVATVAEATEADMDKAVSAARRAF